MKVLVMGGTRFNGRALVNELVRHDHEVTVFNRGQTPGELPDNVERLYGDRRDYKNLTETLRGREFDCVQDISGVRPEDVKGLLAALDDRFGHYIFPSSTVIYTRSNLLPITEDHPVDRSENQDRYGLNKLTSEEYLMERFRHEGLPVTVVPFSMVFGPHNHLVDREARMFHRIANGRPVLIPGDGTTLSQIGHVDDEAAALRMMMLNPATFGKRYNLTGADYWSDQGYVDTFAEVMETTVEKVFVPSSVMDEIWDAGRASSYLIQRVAPYIHPWNESTLFSIERLKKDIDWQPAYSFPEAVAQTWKWFCDSALPGTLGFDYAPEDELLERLLKA